jgi:hypothetical protein
VRTSLRSLLLSEGTTEAQRIAAIIKDALTLPDGRMLPTIVLDDPDCRRMLTRRNPLLFAVLYFPKALSAETDVISFNEAHLDLYEDAERWIEQWESNEPVDFDALRDCYVWPRGTGKSTMVFKILPAWLGAHLHIRFLAAFSDSAEQAQMHLGNLRRELAENQLLKQDYPDFCRPKKSTQNIKLSGTDTMASYMAQNGFVFKAFGVGHPVRGLKDGDDRPDLILVDDVEKGEENYSLNEMAKRLNTLRNDIFYLEITARVVMVGTVTRPGSVVHQLVQTVISNEEPEEWIKGSRITVHYRPAILENGDGTERSLWPERWPLSYLLNERQFNGTSFYQEMMNDPRMGDLRYWTSDLFVVKPMQPYWRQIIWVDPAVTYNDESDWTGFAVLSLTQNKVLQVHEAFRRKISGPDLRKVVIELLQRYPDIVYVMCERNQGGELWAEMVLHGLPVKVNPKVFDNFPQTSSFSNKKASKHIRCNNLCMAYQRGSVIHERQFPGYETEALSWPNGLIKDTVDAVATGAQHLWAASQLTRRQQLTGRRQAARTTRYARR